MPLLHFILFNRMKFQSQDNKCMRRGKCAIAEEGIMRVGIDAEIVCSLDRASLPTTDTIWVFL
jgi:hypothetical protein